MDMPTHKKMMSVPWLNLINWALDELHSEKGDGLMTQGETPPDFEAYLQDLLRRSTRSLSEVENQATDAALYRCRKLVGEIKSTLLHKKNNQRIDLASLADFQVSLERAASVLGQKDGRRSPEADEGEP
jgi:hypothetical protein